MMPFDWDRELDEAVALVCGDDDTGFDDAAGPAGEETESE